MNEDRFWEILDRTSATTTKEKQLALFRAELQKLSLPDLDAFALIFGDVFARAYNWDLWLVAWLACRGMCSDDSFHDLILWLISRGRSVFESALEDPEAVTRLIYESDSPRFELFGYVPGEVHLQKTDRPPNFFGRPHPKQPTGGDWLRPELKDRSGSQMLNLSVVFDELTDADFVAIQARFPRLWEFCIEKGIIRTGAKARSQPETKLPTPEQIAATINPTLAKTDFAAYLKALGDAFQQTYKKKP